MSVVRVEFDSFQKFDCPDLGCCLGSVSVRCLTAREQLQLT